MKLQILFVLAIVLTLTTAKFHFRHRKIELRLRHRALMRYRHRLHADGNTSTSSSSSSSSVTSSSSSSSSSSVTSSSSSSSSTSSSSSASSSAQSTAEWAQQHAFASVLIAPAFPKDKCVVPNSPKSADDAAAGGAAAGLAASACASGKVVKHLELRKKRVSIGAASYYFDQMDYLFLYHFEADVKEMWKAFHANALPDLKKDAAEMNGGIDVKALEKTCTDSKWDKAEQGKFDYVCLIREYDIDGQEFNQAKSELNLQELTYLNIRENIKSDVEESECSNCFKNTKKELMGFFKYIDCNQDNIISAENMYNGMKNMKPMQYPKTTTTMINAFFVNAMEHHSAGLDPVDFQFGMLVGMYERVITENKMSETVLNAMKVSRRQIIEGGGGPGRR